MPKLSIIIPTFNSATTIQRCLLSIRLQTFTDYEIVIQDGASSDRTVDLIREFTKENPKVKLELKQEPDKGAYDAMNKGMCRANGKWLYFLGSDDELYDQDVLGKMLGSDPPADTDVLYGNVKMIGRVNAVADGTIYDGPFDLAKLLRKNICHQAIFYRASLLREVGSYNTKYAVLADWDLNMRCWAKGRFRYRHVTVARFYSGGISSQYRPDTQFYADVKANEFRYFGKWAEQARRAARIAPRRVLRALARRLEITRWK
jgi:glycosyltransferase involved in cell wall biosynthesis